MPLTTRAALAALLVLAASPALSQTMFCTVPTFPGDVVVFSSSGQWGCPINGGTVRLDNHASATLSLVTTDFAAGPSSNPVTHQGPLSDRRGHTLAGAFFAHGPDDLAPNSPFTIGLNGRTDVQNGYLLFYAARADLTVTNAGTFNVQGGGLALERATFGQTLTFHNASGANFNLLDDSGVADNDPTQASLFINHQGASFVKAASTGESVVSVAFNNEGRVSTEGNLRFSGGGTHTDGVFESTGAAGMITFNGEHDIHGHVILRGMTVLGQYGDPSTRMFVAGLAGLEVQSGVLLINAGGLQHDGEVRVAAGAVLASGGEYFRGGAGSVLNIGGTFNNFARWSDSSNSLTRVDGALQNLQGAAGQITINGRLEHQGYLGNGVDSQLVLNGVAVSAPGSMLDNEGKLWVNGQWQHDGSVTNGASGIFSVSGTWQGNTVFANAGRLELLAGANWSGGGQLTNTGTLIVGTGAAMAVDRLDSQAGLLTVDGSLDTGVGNTLTLSGGVLNGNGLINGDVFVGGGAGIASFRPGHSPGHFTINGALTLGNNGELELQVQRLADGSLAWDRVSAASISFLDGATVRFEIGGGVVTTQAQTLGFLDCGSGCSFAPGVHWVVDGAPAGTTLAFGSSGLQLNVSAVPEPATVLLWLGGLLALAGFKRRTARATG
ncbi:hypothetical protein ACG04R_18395 [Roseateles sp. BYS78W]|uniref:PEP-CTERM protein-sorting domain-containing protein n=1 Tax=Pelomonas candidula TaxID=3299025 RepID=A0ABW7HFH7_9BURK